MGIEPTEDDSHRPPPVLKTGPATRSGRATAAFVLWKSARCTKFPVDVGAKGHINNSASGLRAWPEGFALVEELSGASLR